MRAKEALNLGPGGSMMPAWSLQQGQRQQDSPLPPWKPLPPPPPVQTGTQHLGALVSVTASVPPRESTRTDVGLSPLNPEISGKERPGPARSGTHASANRLGH